MIARHAPRALFALAVAAVALLFAIAGKAERIGGGEPILRFEVAVPMDALDTVSPGELEQLWRARLGRYALRIEPGAGHRTGAPLIAEIEVTGAVAADAGAIARSLSVPGVMSMRFVVSDSETARSWFKAIKGGGPRTDGVEAVPDAWGDRDGKEHVDYYVTGPDAVTVAAALASLAPLPPELDLRYERVMPPPDAPPEAGAPHVRTYLIERTPILTGADVADASVSYDAGTLRPEVALVFNQRGAVRFGDATANGMGRRLAIVVDDRVVSAPIIQSAIRGGHATITMGAGDARSMEADASALVDALRSGADGPALPAGIEARLVGADEQIGARWALRGLAAVVAGALAWLAAALLARRGGVVVAPLGAPGLVAAPPAVGALAIAAAITIGLPLALIAIGRQVTLPGVSSDIADMMAARGNGAGRTSLGIFALGIMPLLSGFWLAELIALVVPRWRTARLGTAAARLAIDRLALALTVGLAGLQAYFIVQYLDSLGVGGAPVLAGGTLTRIALFATLVGGVMVHVVAASLITRHGLANGVVALVAVGFAVGIVEREPLHGAGQATTVLALIAGIAVLSAALARLRPPGGARLPWGGVVPVSVTEVVIGLLGLLALVSNDAGHVIADYWHRSLWIDAAVAVPLVALTVWSRRADWSPAPALLSLAFVLALVLAPLAVDAGYRPAIGAIAAATFGGSLVELAAGVRARLRLGAAVDVLEVHDVGRADRAADALTAAGIGHAMLGVHVRAILRMLGAYCPIVVRVAAADAERARAAIAAPEPTPAAIAAPAS